MSSFEREDEQGGVFCFGGAREVVDRERVLSLLSGLPLDDASFRPRILKLSNKSFTASAAEELAAAFGPYYSTFERADLSDMIAGLPTEEALLVLERICGSLGNCERLVDVDVSDNALGQPGVLACRSVLSGKPLKKLCVCNNGLSAEATVSLAELLLGEDGTLAPPLETFHFFNNMSGHGGALAVAKIVAACPHLCDFRFSSTRAGSEGCCAVALALVKSGVASLTALDLSDNSFGGRESSSCIASLLQRQTGLTSLNLRDSGLGEQGVHDVLNALRQSQPQKIVLLDLSGNDVEAQAAKDVADFLPLCISLQELHMDDNSLESEGAKTISAAVNNLPVLKKLSMCSCEITAAGAYALAKAFAKSAAFSTLKLDGNAISERGVVEIQGLFGRAGKILEIEDNDEDGEDDMEDAEEVVAAGTTQEGEEAADISALLDRVKL